MNTSKAGMKDQLRQAAIELFKEEGLQNVTIKKICDRVSCSEGTFYYHFGSMQGLIESFGIWNSVITSDLLLEVMALSGAWNKLWRIHKAYIDLAVSFGPDMYWTMISQASAEERKFKLYNEHSLSSLIEPFIQEGQISGEIRNPTAAELLCKTVGLTMYGVIHYWHLCSGTIDLEEKMRCELANLYALREDLR